MHLIERPDRRHQAAKGQITGKVNRRRHENRRNDGDPAITRSHPGQLCQRGHQQADCSEKAVDIKANPAILVGLSTIERDRIDVLIDPHQREAQLGLFLIAVSIVFDQVCDRRAS